MAAGRRHCHNSWARCESSGGGPHCWLLVGKHPLFCLCCRRWRNAVAAGDEAWQQQIEARLRPLSAGELMGHSSEEEQDEL